MFEIELFIYIKMDLALNNLKGWYAIKPKQPTNSSRIISLLSVPWFHIFLSNTKNVLTDVFNIAEILTGATTQGLSGPGSNGSNELSHQQQALLVKISQSDKDWKNLKLSSNTQIFSCCFKFLPRRCFFWITNIGFYEQKIKMATRILTKECSTFPCALELEPHCQMQFCLIPGIFSVLKTSWDHGVFKLKQYLPRQ